MKTDQEWFDRWTRSRGDFRRLAFIVLLVIAVVAGLFFVRWVARGVGLGRIGEFYQQADELGTP